MAEAELEARPKGRAKLPGEEFTQEGTYFTPAVDIYETPNELILLADMPGVKKEAVEIDLKDDSLTVMGKVDDVSDQGELILAEYRIGNYFRTFRLTEVIDQSKIAAAMSDGVLRLTMPKVAKAIPRKIAVTTD